MRRLFRLSAVALVVAALGVPAAAQAVTAPAQAARVGVCEPGLGVGLVEIPAGTRDPRAQTYIVDRVRAGTSFERRFQICNGTPAPITVQLYAGAATVDNGAFTVVEGRVDNELSRWISVSPSSVTVPSGQRALATARLAVPAGVPDGERYAVLLAELPARPGADGVSTASRVGVRVYLDVGEGAGKPSDFVIESLQATRGSDGSPRVLAQVRNTGARALDLRGELALSDGPGGLSAGPFPATLGTTLKPGDASPVLVVLDKAIDGGPWRAVLTLRSGTLERRAEATITFPTESGVKAPAVTAKALPLAKDPSVVIPVAVGLVGLLLLVLLVVGYLTSRRRARERRPSPAAA